MAFRSAAHLCRRQWPTGMRGKQATPACSRQRQPTLERPYRGTPASNLPYCLCVCVTGNTMQSAVCHQHMNTCKPEVQRCVHCLYNGAITLSHHKKVHQYHCRTCHTESAESERARAQQRHSMLGVLATTTMMSESRERERERERARERARESERARERARDRQRGRARARAYPCGESSFEPDHMKRDGCDASRRA